MTETKARTTDGFHEIADKGIAQVKVNFDKAKAATNEGADLFKNSYATAAKGATDYNLKFFELSTTHARKHFETMTAQTKELAALAQKMTTDITEPLKTGVARAFNNSAT
jgi:hypothetical protein